MSAVAYSGQIWDKRYFWWSLVRADLHTRYRRSVLGMGWSLLQPIAMTAVFCVVFARLFDAPVASFAPYVLSGMALWSFLSTVTTDGCMAFYRNEAYIRQQPAPLAIYPLRTTLSALIHFLLALGVLVVFVAGLKIAGLETAGPGFTNTSLADSASALPFGVGVVCVLPALALMFVLGWALAICAGIVTVLFQDTQHLVQIGLQIVFYATPVFYPAGLLREKGLSWLVDYNPVAAMMHLLREPILNGQLPHLSAVALSVGTTLAVCLLAVLGLKKMERRLIFFL